MKIVALISLISAFCYLGVSISNHIMKRVKILRDIIHFFNYCKSEISFLNKDKLSIMREYIGDNKSFKQVLNMYINSEQNNDNEYKKEVNNLQLSDNQKKDLLIFFEDFGKNDTELEMSKIDKQIINFNNYLQEEEKQCSTKSSLYKKLCSLFGLIVCILFI